MIAYTQRAGTHDIWVVSDADGSNPRRLTSGAGDNQGAHVGAERPPLAFQSNALCGPWQIFAMLVDGIGAAPDHGRPRRSQVLRGPLACRDSDPGHP